MRVRFRVAAEREDPVEAGLRAVNPSLLFIVSLSLQLHLEARVETCNI